ncbi:D-glycero-beta-D-manno-heptose 1,7-bisphosphate 7-phosphatase [Diaphorobacter sp. HDW4B]|uniref:D-glycero-beta-D-manno-heptose 1,7-bisphosphate 7-phosphatase n=1 Tax=Diaphorobacter sp. HDW4B TaxID=2714925 RepID=UPI00140984D6|nr:D-glycero-beta-D-manno-heptose 1,7-bisphosphate 7-phosphatase [Diaphorobacter sp. HDW4B]QIL70246.1 D-glycero-beta-D-manno-heptose 1,7-bisphosphate 7-phosphatase [Diaphorobacter sp. HDW4B]
MKIAIIDRDGTLNALGNEYIATPDEWVPIPGALEAVARLSRAGWHVVIATNQPGLGRGVIDVHALNAIHARLLKQVQGLGGRIDAVFFCPHSDAEHCSCRKPAPGLMEQIRDRYGAESADIVAVGSSVLHLQAATAAGISQLHMVCTGAAADVDAAKELPAPWPQNTHAHADLNAFVDFIAATAQAAKTQAH